MPAVTAPKRLTVPSENTNLDKDSKETLVCSKGTERGCEITEPKIAAEVRKLQKGSEEVMLPLRSKGQRNSARGRKGGGALGARRLRNQKRKSVDRVQCGSGIKRNEVPGTA